MKPLTRPTLYAAMLLAFALPAAAQCERVVVSADPDYQPLHWYDGRALRGASIDLAVRILEDLGIPHEVRYTGPWKRVLAAAAAGQVDLVATLKIQPERERYLAFAHPAAFPNPVAVFIERQRAFSFRDWNDLKHLRGGVAMGNRFGPEFDKFAEANLHLHEAGTLDTNFRKLGLGRIDYFVVGLFAGEKYLASHGLNARFVALRPFVAEDRNYFAFARNSPCVKHLEAFEARLKEIVKSGGNLAVLNASLMQADIKVDSTTLGRK
ncbi:substrate-binding periplasmic protein [Pseudoduganella namucuonensis]|uniref:Amino acid ABC transporter substrate-binding protein, PAAT family n=1 Tax=Pseudoduganella namucuonensis TaxID=1035707 RepID=A0A1I7L781_9BURK|nr:transporter substrate-binding domain-containing protein [Pseudoduganella namucuonensis]SFV05571.1 amino acid ABC transporter substrate-binding protein, PAAT family [Pseudoduganella namucuonensis]